MNAVFSSDIDALHQLSLVKSSLKYYCFNSWPIIHVKDKACIQALQIWALIEVQPIPVNRCILMPLQQRTPESNETKRGIAHD